MLSHVFLPKFKLDGSNYNAIVSGDLPVRTGQWIIDPYGKTGQFVSVVNGSVILSYAGKGDDFYSRTKRFVRSVDHYKRNGASIVESPTAAPRETTPLAAVQASVQRSMAGSA